MASAYDLKCHPRHRRNRSWAREHPGRRDEAWFKREVAPKLDVFSLSEIADATGLSLTAWTLCSPLFEARSRRD